MLEEYRDLFASAASIIPDWNSQAKNDLCRKYVENKHDEVLRNAYFGAVMCKYWNLLPKYYYMSCNCASPEECYGWLVDSVSCCLDLASWDNPNSSIYKDPNGPDKVINRCMKCARLTYYQFINRKKRRDNFGLLSIDELKELFGTSVTEPADYEQEIDISDVMIKDFVTSKFFKKDYFVAFLIDCIVNTNVFDVTPSEQGMFFEFNLRKLVKILNTLDDSYPKVFAELYELPEEDVVKGFKYVKGVPEGAMRKKVQTALETLKHSELIQSLVAGGAHVN